MVHRLARAPLAALIAALAAAAPLGAQGSWQGVVTFHVAARDAGSDMDYYAGPGVARIDTKYGEMGSSIIINPADSTEIIIIPSRQMYMVNSMKGMAAEVQKKMAESKITNTGKTEVVAGHTCTYYHAVDPSGKQSDACIATDMGTFAAFQSPGGGGGGASLWQRLLGHEGGFFPLKVISHKDGKDEVEMVATKIETKSLDPSLFVPPSSYKKMDMGGMAHGAP